MVEIRVLLYEHKFDFDGKIVSIKVVVHLHDPAPAQHRLKQRWLLTAQVQTVIRQPAVSQWVNTFHFSQQIRFVIQ